jgi:transcriptional regulator with XRE-family HTH domain
MAEDQDFAEWLKAARRRAQLSQRELSEVSGIPIRTIQEYEQGRCEPGLSRGLTLVAMLGDWFDSSERILTHDHA